MDFGIQTFIYFKEDALKYERMLKRQNHNYLDWLIASEKNEIS